MNNFLTQRFLGSKPQSVIERLNPHMKQDETPPVQSVISPAVLPETLRQKLLEKLRPKPTIVIAKNQASGLPNIELVHFANLYEFVHWYENNKSVFSTTQQAPLESLVEAKQMTIGGCNCDREKRKFIADDYFKKFWIQNKKTDLLPTLQAALKTKKIILGDFLSFPE